MRNGASFFFIVVYLHTLKRSLLYSLIHIPEKVYGSVGVIILLLMILTAFLRLCFALGSNELLGGNSYFTNLSTAFPIIRK